MCSDAELDRRLRAARAALDAADAEFARDLDDPEQIEAFLARIEAHRRAGS